MDAHDVERFDEVKHEMGVLLSANELKDIPMVILGNKIDKKGAVSEPQLKKEIGISETTGKDPKKQPKGIRPMEVFMCSLRMKAGFAEGLKWLSNVI